MYLYIYIYIVNKCLCFQKYSTSYLVSNQSSFDEFGYPYLKCVEN
jgi:hypothetical protein